MGMESWMPILQSMQEATATMTCHADSTANITGVPQRSNVFFIGSPGKRSSQQKKSAHGLDGSCGYVDSCWNRFDDFWADMHSAEVHLTEREARVQKREEALRTQRMMVETEFAQLREERRRLMLERDGISRREALLNEFESTLRSKQVCFARNPQKYSCNGNGHAGHVELSDIQQGRNSRSRKAAASEEVLPITQLQTLQYCCHTEI